MRHALPKHRNRISFFFTILCLISRKYQQLEHNDNRIDNFLSLDNPSLQEIDRLASGCHCSQYSGCAELKNGRETTGPLSGEYDINALFFESRKDGSDTRIFSGEALNVVIVIVVDVMVSVVSVYFFHWFCEDQIRSPIFLMDNSGLAGLQDAAVKFLNKFLVGINELSDSLRKTSEISSFGSFLDLRTDDTHPFGAYVSAHRSNGVRCVINGCRIRM